MSSYSTPCAHRGSLHSSSRNFFLALSWCGNSKRASVFLRKRITLLARMLPGGAALGGAAMRKHDHSIPPVFKHNSGLNNSAIRSRKCKRPNALKHGFYSEAPLIPGEDPREFQEILAELMDEWKPSGPTLRDDVFELAEF